MARIRTQKAVAGRIDLNYHRRWHKWRVGRVLLVLGCTVAAAAWVAVASIRYDPNAGKLKLVDAIHNPGRLTSAHANIEHDCRACHDGGRADPSQPGYWLNVSDQACLTCHDGSLHHQNQKLAAAHGDVSFADFAVAVSDPGHPHGKRSASCVSCHVEHRGHDLLIGASNQLCVHCHADIGMGMESGQPRANMRAVKFTLDDHPKFGTRLMPPGQPTSPGEAASPRKWIDPTNLKFGHALHAKPIRAAFIAAAGGDPATATAEYLATDCLACHENGASPMPVRDLSKIDPGEWSSRTPPPYLPPGSVASAMPASEEKSYMGAISFDRHCFACHVDSGEDFKSLVAPELATDDFEAFAIEKFAIPHQDARVVRGYVEAAVRASFAKFESDRTSKLEAALAAAKKAAEEAKSGAATEPDPPPAEEPATPRRRGRGAAAEPEPAPSDAGGGRRGRAGRGGAAEPAPAEKTPAAWIAAHANQAASQANTELAGIEGFADRALPEPGEETELAVLVDYYTAYVLAKQCYACHGMTGDLPTTAVDDNRKLWSDGVAFATAPTGIPDAPRRWFAASDFDHFAHRHVDCIDCHAPAWTSGTKETIKTATADVLTSDIDGSYPGSPGTATSARTCVSCHHADTRDARGATDSCISCHWYHDQKLARPITGPLQTPATQPTSARR